MKYKCKDCGQEYDIKPDFCDCGNNVFDEIIPAQTSQPATTKPAPHVETLQQEHTTYKNHVDIPSLLIFFTCIILSILAWIFIGKDTAKEVITQETPPQKSTQIPTIDKIWNSKAPTVITEQLKPVPEPVAVKVVEQPKPQSTKTEQKKTSVKQPAQNTKPATSTTQLQPVVQQQKVATPTMTEKQKQEIINKLTTKKEPPKSEPVKLEQKQPPTKVEPQKIVEQPKQEAQVKTPDPTQLKKELDAYKIALRNKLGRSINFAAVIGDGKCAVTFKIDEIGNLTNRNFAVQSTNNSLNDAVYAAIIQNPTFKEPPEGYKGETLTLTVTMYGGNFEVGLK